MDAVLVRTPLTVLFDLDELAAEIAGGWVNVAHHPDAENLTILNYSNRTQYANRWNPVTLAARGLIVDAADDTIVARPFPKFFHAADEPSATFDDRALRVFEKVDGSLGTVYTAPDGLPAVATRGRFDSDQAQWATRWLRDTHPLWRPRPGWTTQVEIVYPDNRVVVDYGDTAELVWLADRHIATGAEILDPVGDRWDWPGRRAQHFDLGTINDPKGLADLEDLNPAGEGFVVVDAAVGRRWKVKFARYVTAHQLLFGLSDRRCWTLAAAAHLGSVGVPLGDTAKALYVNADTIAHVWSAGRDGGDWHGELLVDLPDEFTPILTERFGRYTSRVHALVAAAVELGRTARERAGLDPTPDPVVDRNDRKRLARVVFSQRQWNHSTATVAADMVMAAATADTHLWPSAWRMVRPADADVS